MNHSAKSVAFFALYLSGMGVGFIFMPNTLLNLLGMPPTTEVWSRVVGLLALLLAYYYMQAARQNLKHFFAWTVHTRIAAFLCFTAFVLAKLAGPILILLGAVDLAAALWTWWALRGEDVVEAGATTAVAPGK